MYLFLVRKAVKEKFQIYSIKKGEPFCVSEENVLFELKGIIAEFGAENVQLLKKIPYNFALEIITIDGVDVKEQYFEYNRVASHEQYPGYVLRTPKKPKRTPKKKKRWFGEIVKSKKR